MGTILAHLIALFGCIIAIIVANSSPNPIPKRINNILIFICFCFLCAIIYNAIIDVKVNGLNYDLIPHFKVFEDDTNSIDNNNSSQNRFVDVETDGREEDEIPDYYFSENAININGCDIHPLIFEKMLKNRDRIRIGYKLLPVKGDLTGTFICWVRLDGDWTEIGSFEVVTAEVEYINTFVMDPPLSFDALVITPAKTDWDKEVYYNDEYTFYETRE